MTDRMTTHAPNGTVRTPRLSIRSARDILCDAMPVNGLELADCPEVIDALNRAYALGHRAGESEGYSRGERVGRMTPLIHVIDPDPVISVDPNAARRAEWSRVPDTLALAARELKWRTDEMLYDLSREWESHHGTIVALPSDARGRHPGIVNATYFERQWNYGATDETRLATDAIAKRMTGLLREIRLGRALLAAWEQYEREGGE